MKILKRKKRGFTIIEISVVILVLGILMSVLFVSLRGGNIQGKANALQLRAAKEQIDLALFEYRQTFGAYPSSLDALSEVPAGIDSSQYPPGGFISKKSLLDPWKEPYHYEMTSDGNYEIFTLGSDKKAGGEGAAADVYFSALE